VRTTIEQLRAFSPRQWKVAGRTYLLALAGMGVIGETLPGASQGRVIPVAWWNWVTLALSPPLVALIAATFVPDGQPRRLRRRDGAAAGSAGAIGTLAMACPACNPLAIPLFGSAGVLSFLAPERGVIALLSVVLLALTLLLRLRTAKFCRLKSARAVHHELSRRDLV
jgi:amino acid transporter